MLGQVLDVDGPEITQSHVQRQKGHVAALDLEPFHQVLAEMQSGRRRGDGSLVLRVNRLIALLVDRFDFRAYPLGQRRLAEFVQRRLELVVVAVEQETKRPPARGRVVDHLGHHQVVVAEIELVADTYLARRIDQHVPQAQVAVQLAQQENFDLGSRLLLVAVQTGRKHFRIVEYQHVALPEIIDHFLEYLMLDLACAAVQHHQPRLVAAFGRVFREHIGRKAVIVLG